VIRLCLFCGQDADERGHGWRCDGRQGAIEAAEGARLPRLASGLTEATYAASRAAADSIEDARGTQRRLVLAAIRAAGPAGLTDDELQELLELDGSSERPRRWELWKLEAIAVKVDGEGHPVKRLTRTQRRAVVWVAA